jgi:hypothetical protein
MAWDRAFQILAVGGVGASVARAVLRLTGVHGVALALYTATAFVVANVLVELAIRAVNVVGEVRESILVIEASRRRRRVTRAELPALPLSLSDAKALALAEVHALKDHSASGPLASLDDRVQELPWGWLIHSYLVDRNTGEVIMTGSDANLRWLLWTYEWKHGYRRWGQVW